MGGLLSFFAGPAQLKGLLIAAAAMLIACLSLTTWALWERSGRFQAERDATVYRNQSAVLADSLTRCNAGARAVEEAGKAAQKGVADLLAAARKAQSANASLVISVREILARPTPTRPDGTPKDCGDARREIEKRGGAK